MAERSQLFVTNPRYGRIGDGSVLGAQLSVALSFLLITSQRRNDIWQNRNITDRRVTGHKRNDIVKVPSGNYSVTRLCELFHVCLKVSCKW